LYHLRVIPPRHEGRYGRSSRNVRRGCGGRVGAQGEARVERSTKPCGPDTPMLVSTLRAQEPGGTVTKTPGTPRRARNKSSNIARGMPDVFGCTCDHSCAFSHYSCTRDRGCNGARHSLRPLSPRDTTKHNPGRITPRECFLMFSHLSCPGRGAARSDAPQSRDPAVRAPDQQRTVARCAASGARYRQPISRGGIFHRLPSPSRQAKKLAGKAQKKRQRRTS
jgi:hypothetical protein